MELWDGWNDFLKVIASDHDLTSDQKAVFLMRLSRQNIKKTNQDIANEVIKSKPDKALYAYNKRMNEVFDKLSQSFPEINSDSKKKVDRTRACLEKAYLEQQNQVKAEASSYTIASPDWQKVCREMLNSQKPYLRQQVTQIGCEVDVYVPLGLVERKHQSRRRDNYSLSPEQGSDFFQPTEEEIIQTYEHNEFLKEVIQQGKSKKSKGKRIAIIGEPGAGKTTTLEQIAFSKDTPGFPIWISLKSLGKKSLEQYLRENWLKNALKTSDLTHQQKVLEELFKTGEVLLLLDGVDEMPASSPVDALGKIREELTGWVADARVVLTCRVNVWEASVNSLQDFDIYRTLDFSYGDGDKPDQVKQFICEWFIKAEKPELGETLREKLDEDRHQRIRDLVKNPLRLSLLCQSWYFKPEDEEDLPGTKAMLYEQFKRAFYDWKDEPFHTSVTERKKLNTALGLLAREAIDKEKSRFAIRESFAVDVMGEDLFNLACKLHWLNFVYKDADTDEKVYAFFHPTFQEYFAACAIDDWHYFLNHNNVNPDPFQQYNNKPCVYRIFEPQWKEVILLWLGRPKEEVSKEQKEEFIGSLVEFDDGFQNLYWYQAYFLAASGIAEFCDCSRVDAIGEQIVRWAFGYFDTTKQAWQPSFYPLDKQAKTIIRETLHSKVITELSKLLHFCQNEQMRKKIVENNGLASDERIIGEIAFTLIEFSPNNFEATEAAKRLINNSLNNTNDFCLVPPFWLKNIDFSAQLEILRRSIFPEQQFAENLEEENLGNPEDILELINFINTVEDGNPQKYKAMSKLPKIVTGNLEAVTPVLEIIKRSMYSNQETDLDTLFINLECLQRIGVGSPEIISVLFELMNSDLDYIKLKALWVLIAVGAGNQDVFNFIIRLVHDENNWSIRLNALGSLKAILQANLFSSTVTNLKVYLQDSVYKNNRAVYVESYWTLWHCAQNMTYPDFYKSWHDDTSTVKI